MGKIPFYVQNATTKKFKEDIASVFSDSRYKDMTLLELGCHQGNTTRTYAEYFNKVIDMYPKKINIKDRGNLNI